jgi:uncharacterized coiled-coil protein SlyX
MTTVVLAVLGALVTLLAGIPAAYLGYVATQRKTQADSAEKRDERLSAEAREMLAGYRSDIATLRAELAATEERAQRREDAQSLKIEKLETKVELQRGTIEGLQDEVAVVRRENKGLRAQLAALTGLAAGVEADTAGGGE